MLGLPARVGHRSFLFAKLSLSPLLRRTGVVVFLALAGFTAARANTIFQDATFNYSDWSLATYKSNLGWVNALTYASNSRIVYVALALPIVAPSKVLGVHTYVAPNSTYDPAISGAIGTVKTKASSSGYGGTCASQPRLQLFGPALRQGGKDYISGDANGYPVGTYSGPCGSNKTDTSTRAASDFCLVTNTTIAGNDNVSCDINQHPDFSASGAPIQCGFYTYSDASVPPSPVPPTVFTNSSDGHTYYAVLTAYDNWSCEFTPPTGYFHVYKSIGSLPLPPNGATGTAVTVQAICTNTPPFMGQQPINVGYSWQMNPMPYGTSCTFTELAPPPNFTNAQGDVCSWQPAPPPQTVTLNAPSATVTFTNSYTCTPVGTLSIYKLILDPSGIPLVLAGPWGLNAPTFNIRANCGGQGPGSVSLAPPILAGSIPNLPHGTTCTIDEPTLPSPFTDSAGNTCTWQQQSPLSQTVPINGPVQSVTVTNTFTCAPPAPTTTSIRLHKSLAHPPGVMAPTGVSYDVTVTCGTSSQTLPIPTGGKPGYATTQQFLVGSSCTIQETLPSKCSWGTVTYRYQLSPGAPVQTYVGNSLTFNLSDVTAVDIENTLLAACP